MARAESFLKLTLVLAIFFVGCARPGYNPQVAEQLALIRAEQERQKQLITGVQSNLKVVQQRSQQPQQFQQLQQQQETRVPIEYILIGEPKRTRVVAEYLSKRGCTVIEIRGRADGWHEEQRWPGVKIKPKESSREDEEGWVPVSDKAVREGLCDIQTKTLDALPCSKKMIVPAVATRQWTPSVVAAEPPPPFQRDPITNCESVSFQVTPGQVIMTIDMGMAGYRHMEGHVVRAHSRYLNSKDQDNDVLATTTVTSGMAVFTFRNRRTIERMWFDVPSLDEWVVPCSRFLYPDRLSHLAIEVSFTADDAFTIPEDARRDDPNRHGYVHKVYGDVVPQH